MERRGHEVLSDIDSRAGDIRSRMESVNAQVTREKSEIEALRHEQAECYLKLAELHADLIDDPQIMKQVRKADDQALSRLKSRDQARTQLDQKLVSNQAHQKDIEQNRAALLVKVESFAKKLHAAEDKALESLDGDKAYVQMMVEIEEVEAQIMRTERKISVAQDDYTEKAKPYKDDPLFYYLWERGFGTSTYKRGKITYMLDRWVADIVRYDPVRRNYAMLSGIPKKMAEHKLYLEKKSDALERTLNDVKDNVFEDQGVAKLQADYDAQRDALNKIDQEISELEKKHQAIIKSIEDYDSNGDAAYVEAIQTLKDLYARKSLRKLRRDAQITTTREDDHIVQKLFDLDDQIDDAEKRVSTYQKSLRQENWRLNEVQKVRSEFKERRYDNRQTVFRDGNMFSMLLDQFVSGVVTNPYFWASVGRLCLDVLDEIDLDDVFEGGGRRRGRPSYRHRSRSRSRSRPRRSSRSSGGFKTGGRF